jgi:23S rRNA (guanosine2251-2'-O)-methyltransferase
LTGQKRPKKPFGRRDGAARPPEARHTAMPSRTASASSSAPDPRQKPAQAPQERPAGQKAHKERPAFRRPSAELAVLYGYHAVREALRAQRRKCLDLFATAAAAEKLGPEIAVAGVFTHIVANEDLSARLGADAVHQGVLLEARPLPPADIADIASKSGLVLVLDQITDPHNVGAILRTAAAFAVDALVTTDRHAPELSGVLAKAASGGLEHVTIVEVVNLARALDELKDAGYLCVGLDSDAPAALDAALLTRPVALVLGAEGKGLRRLSKERCDLLARLDMPGPIKSLNVSNACAVALALVTSKLANL